MNEQFWVSSADSAESDSVTIRFGNIAHAAREIFDAAFHAGRDAGDGGSQLWGGSGFAQDVLTGGAGADVFIGGKYQGSDVVGNASVFDSVYLYDATLSDIAYTVSDGRGTVALQFKSGNVLSVQGSDFVSAAFVLADGSAYRYNNTTQSWQNA